MVSGTAGPAIAARAAATSVADSFGQGFMVTSFARIWVGMARSDEVRRPDAPIDPLHDSYYMFLKIGMKVRLTGSVSGRLRSRIVPRPASSRVTAATAF